MGRVKEKTEGLSKKYKKTIHFSIFHQQYIIKKHNFNNIYDLIL